jgi:hypothetical protein
MRSLVNPRQESYARLRAELVPKREAYTRAGFSPHHGNPSRLEQMPHVRDRIAELCKSTEELVEIQRYKMIQELDRLAYANTIDLWERGVDGYLAIKDLTALPTDLTASIAEIAVEPITDYEQGADDEPSRKITIGQKIRVKQHGKLEAMKQLAELIGMAAPKRLEFSGPNGGALTLAHLVGASYETGGNDAADGAPRLGLLPGAPPPAE